MPLPFTADELAPVLRPLASAEMLPKSAYVDTGVLAAERARIFEPAWLCVGRASEVELPGQWLLAGVTPEGVIVARGPDLALRAFYNACRHRGARLVTRPSGRCGAFTCPYHAWRYELTGALARAPGTDGLESFARGEHGLAALRVETWAGFVFVNATPDAPDLASWLAPVPAHLARLRLEGLVLARRAEHEVAANWKLLIENFQESHHFATVHPGLQRFTPLERSTSFVTEGAWLGGVMEMADGAETVSTDGALHGRPRIPGATDGDARRVFDYFCWPNLMLSAQPDYLLAYRVWPLAPDRSRVTADVFVHPAAAETRDVLEFWDVTNAEDRAICESQQLGLASRGYARGRYATSEDGVHAFDQRIARAYLAELEART